jgi:mannose-6-phosphate isomerase-like protein (cupin superfamily)
MNSRSITTRVATSMLCAMAAACSSRHGGSTIADTVANARAPRAEAVENGLTAGTSAVVTAGDIDPVRATGSISEGFEYYTAAALNHIADSLSRGQSTGHRLGDHGTYQYLQIRRPRSGVPEVHDRWTDVTMVQSGRATLLSGGTVNGGHLESPGEHRGGTIAGGSSRPVAAGDLMIIPAGMPHQYLIASGDSLRYLTIKVVGPSRSQ